MASQLKIRLEGSKTNIRAARAVLGSQLENQIVHDGRIYKSANGWYRKLLKVQL